MLKKLNKKGFTLAELLIVIAIIAVLVAIAMPIFSNSLDKARYAVHEANARSLKALGVAAVLSSEKFAAGDTDAGKSWEVSAKYNFATGKFDSKGNVLATTKAAGLFVNDKKIVESNVKAVSGVATSGEVTYKVIFSSEDLELAWPTT